MTQTMKAAGRADRETMAIQKVPRPEPKRGEVFVGVRATGLCGSDADAYPSTRAITHALARGLGGNRRH
jgi:D-arabinose 1-dehydrogenase-like Zn-dependent alcohol dehydrogenase